MAGQTETLIETIMQWIDIGRLKPGDLIDESALVAEFSVSRTPVREALLQLEAGDRAAAIDGLKALLQEPDLTPGLRSRATQVIVALGGTPEA